MLGLHLRLEPLLLGSHREEHFFPPHAVPRIATGLPRGATIRVGRH